MTQCSLTCILLKINSIKPLSPYKLKGISGIRQILTSLAANVDNMATKPEERPNNFTKPIQFKLQLASTFAARIVLTDS